MLQQIGDSLKGHKWLTYLVFGALALIFAAWGAYGIANLDFGGASNVARVNGHDISYDEVRPIWQRQLTQLQQNFGGEVPAGQRALLEAQLVESLVREAMLTDRAVKLGYRVTDAELAEAVREEPAFQVDGKYSADLARARLQAVGLSEEQYAADLRNSLLRAQLDGAIRVSEFATPAEVRQARALAEQQRQVSYALLPLDKYAAAAVISDAAVQAFYDAHKRSFLTTESVHLQYAQLQLSQVTSQLQISDDDARDYYDKNKTRYLSPERRQGRQILIQVSAARNDAAALKRAQEVLAKLEAGGDFAALARQYSDDPGSAARGGQLDYAARDAFVAPFADALFGMKVGEIRGPVKTQYGYHIIRLDGIEPARGKTFAEARPEVEQQLRHDRAADRFGDVQEQIEEKLDQPGETLEGLAKEFGLQLGDVPQFLKGSGGGDLENSKDLQDTVFSDDVLAGRHIGGPVLLGEGRLVLVRDLSHQLPVPKPLSAVRDSVVAMLRKDEGTQAAREAADAAVKRLDGGAAFDAVAKELGVAGQGPRYIGREDPSVPSAVRTAAFSLPVPAAHQSVYRAFPQPDGSVLVLALAQVKTDPPAADPHADAEMAHTLAQQFAAADVNAYQEQVRRAAKVQTNIALLDQQQ